MSLKHRLRNVPGLMWHWTAGSEKQEPTFRALLDLLKPTSIVEIGTHQGVSTALLAEYAPVVTVDILPHPVRAVVWDVLGVADRITEHVCKASAGRDLTIASAVERADLVFVDGCHLMPDVERDFALSIPCGRVILHDYWQSAEDWPDVKAFVDRLDPSSYRTTIRPPFALVEAR